MMNRPSVAMLEKRRDAWLRQLAGLGPCLRGSLCRVRRGQHLAHQLTLSVKNKTHTVYVPLDMVEDVSQWIRNYRRAQRILKEVTVLNMALIHRHVPQRRGDANSIVNRRRHP